MIRKTSIEDMLRDAQINLETNNQQSKATSPSVAKFDHALIRNPNRKLSLPQIDEEDLKRAYSSEYYLSAINMISNKNVHNSEIGYQSSVLNRVNNDDHFGERK